MLIILLMLCSFIQAFNLKMVFPLREEIIVDGQISDHLNDQIHDPKNLEGNRLVSPVARQALFEEFEESIRKHPKYQGFDGLSFFVVDDDRVCVRFATLKGTIQDVLQARIPDIFSHLDIPSEDAEKATNYFNSIESSFTLKNTILTLLLDSPFAGLTIKVQIDNENRYWNDFIERQNIGNTIFIDDLFEISPHIELIVRLKDDKFGIGYDLVRLEQKSYFKTILALAGKSSRPYEIFLPEISERFDTYAFREGALIFKIPGTDKVLLAGVKGLKISDKKIRWRATFKKLVGAKIVSGEVMKIQNLAGREGYIAEKLTKITYADGKEYCLPCTEANMRLLQEKLAGFVMEEGMSVYSALKDMLQPVE